MVIPHGNPGQGSVRGLQVIIGAVARVPSTIIIERAQLMRRIVKTNWPVPGVFTGGVFVDVVAEE